MICLTRKKVEFWNWKTITKQPNNKMKMVNGTEVGQNFAIMNVKSGYWEDENLEFEATTVCQQVCGNLTWRRASLIILRAVPYLRHKNMIWLVIWQNYRSCSRQFRVKCIPCLRQQGQKPYPIQRHIPV